MDEVKTGIVCITQNSQTKPWLIYELGYLQAKTNSVCPLLIGLDFPISPIREIQFTALVKDDFVKMIRGVVQKCGLTDRSVTTQVDSHWNDMYSQIQYAISQTQFSDEPEKDSDLADSGQYKTINDVLIWKKVSEITFPFYKKIINGEGYEKETSDRWADVYVSEPFVDEPSHLSLTPLLLKYTFFDHYVKDGYKLFFLNGEGKDLEYEYEMSNNNKFILEKFYEQYLKEVNEAQAPFPFSPNEKKKREKAAKDREEAENEKMQNRLQRAKRLMPELVNFEEKLLNTIMGHIIFSNDKLDNLDDFKFTEQIVENLKSFNKYTTPLYPNPELS